MRTAVIIPVKNEATSIGSLLSSLFNQSRKPDEVVIVDAGSRDETVEVIKTYIDESYPVRLISVGHAFPGKARNIAIENVSSEVVAMTDGGTVIDKNWLDELVKPLENNQKVDFVWGNYEPIMDTFFQKCQAFAILSPPKRMGAKFVRYGSFISAAMKKKIWEEIGKFPEDLRACEDTVVRKRIEKSRLVREIVPQAVVFWRLNRNLFAMLKKTVVYTKYRIISGTNTSYIFRLTGIYFVLFLLFLRLPYFACFLLFLFLLGRIIKNIEKQEPLLKKMFLNPIFWISVMVLLLLNDLAQISGGLVGLAKVLVTTKNLK